MHLILASSFKSRTYPLATTSLRAVRSEPALTTYKAVFTSQTDRSARYRLKRSWPLEMATYLEISQASIARYRRPNLIRVLDQQGPP